MRATSAPASASASAIVRPSPRAPPVTSATLPSSRNESSTGLCVIGFLAGSWKLVAGSWPLAAVLRVNGERFQRRLGVDEQPAEGAHEIDAGRHVEGERPVARAPREDVADDQRR